MSRDRSPARRDEIRKPTALSVGKRIRKHESHGDGTRPRATRHSNDRWTRSKNRASFIQYGRDLYSADCVVPEARGFRFLPTHR